MQSRNPQEVTLWRWAQPRSSQYARRNYLAHQQSLSPSSKPFQLRPNGKGTDRGELNVAWNETPLAADFELSIAIPAASSAKGGTTAAVGKTDSILTCIHVCRRGDALTMLSVEISMLAET